MTASPWIAFGRSYREFEDAGLAKPGTLVEVFDEHVLIGHINPLRGVCDDCVEFSRDDIVTRYRVVWEPIHESE